MDDATRAELAALRLRAYGPDADIATDPAAIERLIELEALAAPGEPDDRRSPAPPSDEAPATDSPSSDPRGSDDPPDADAPRGADPPRRRTIGVGIAAVICVAIAVALGTTIAPHEVAQPTPPAAVPAEGSSFVRDRTTRALYEIPLDRPLSSQDETPAAEAPTMPASGTVTWAAQVGSYYGWELWIAGTSGAVQPEHCILLRRGSQSEGRCGPATQRSPRSLVVDLDYEDIADGQQPEGMARDQRIGFWWLEDTAITVLIGAQLENR